MTDFARANGREARSDPDTPPFVPQGISITGVRKSFEVTKALDGCSFSASLGEIHAIFGGNGSGKSTLAKVISGVLPVDAGQVNVLGHTPSSPNDARAIGIATVFQEVLVADECSVLDNLYVGADRLWSKNLSTGAKIKAAKTLMAELTGFDLDLDVMVGGLPLSIKQWITIGRALLCQPKVLILDESSAALDLDSTERLFAKMRELRDKGSAVIIVTHRIAEMTRISDRATVLRDGRDVGVLEKADINEKNLLRLMAGRSSNGPAKPQAVSTDMRGESVVLKSDAMKIWPQSRELQFRLHRGEIVGVVGLDGQGQSDFVRILAGIQKAHSSGPMVASSRGGFAPIRSIADAGAHGVSYVSGDRKREGIFTNLSIFENMLLPLYRSTSRVGKLAIIDWSTLSGAFEWEREKLSIRLGDRGDKITSLSGGNQQKVLIGRAFALSPNILILNDPARGVDIGAKGDLYIHLKDFASRGKSVVYMSSEIEELVGFCSRVLVFRNGSVFEELTGDAIEPDRILAAMFGQTMSSGKRKSDAGGFEDEHETVEASSSSDAASTWERPAAAALRDIKPFVLRSPAFDDGGVIPDRCAEANSVSPPLAWDNPPQGTRSFALAVTDPDLPPQFKFPRAFAHWMIINIPANATGLAEGASPGGRLPQGATELPSDFVTFGIPGYGRGYGGPWPPDSAHRYIFTLYALKSERLEISDTADYVEFVRAVIPVTITAATLVGVYGPAKTSLPSAA